ncbi:MAG: deoxyribose-phosphate aldolase [Bacteroidota bacterium]
MQIASFIDHTILKPTTTVADIEKLCLEAVEYQFAAVCVPPPFVKRCKILLGPTDVKVATVVGFPFGYAATESKLAETLLALVDGADEIDMVINLVALKMNDTTFLENEVRILADTVHQKNKLIKVIIESGILSDEEIITCCRIFAPLGIDFMKTSTGYAEKGATVEAVQLMRKNLPLTVKIKASGGIRNYEFAKQLVDAGAERLGCSASVAIVKGEEGAGY